MAVDVHRLADDGLGNSAWLADLGDGSALIVDPSRDPRPSLEEAEKRGLRLRWIAETHLHADFVSGARELAHLRPDAIHLAAAGAELQTDHRPVDDGAALDLGGLTLEVVATPGHTPEHVAYLLTDDGEPQALFSGGTLIAGGVARPDLISPEQTEPLARAAWRSITGRLLDLPDTLPVHPTHGGGSFCSASAGGDPVTTIGEQRTSNPLLQADDEDAFVEQLLGGLGSFPPYFLRLRDVNRRGPRLYGTATPALDRLDPDEVDRRVADGPDGSDAAVLVDVRPIDRYAAGHVPGALSIELRDAFATWLGWLVEDPATPLVFVVDDDQSRDDLVRQCLKVGYEHLAGELAGGMAAWEDDGRPVARTELTDAAPTDRAPVDVRQRSEWEQDHIDGAVHAPLGDLPGDVGDLPGGPLVTHCGHGQRAMSGASLLERAGRDDVAVFTGGPEQWRGGPPDA